MMKKRRYMKPSIETSSFINLAILAGSDKVGLITNEGSNAAKQESANLWDDEMEE